MPLEAAVHTSGLEFEFQNTKTTLAHRGTSAKQQFFRTTAFCNVINFQSHLTLRTVPATELISWRWDGGIPSPKRAENLPRIEFSPSLVRLKGWEPKRATFCALPSSLKNRWEPGCRTRESAARWERERPESSGRNKHPSGLSEKRYRAWCNFGDSGTRRSC